MSKATELTGSTGNIFADLEIDNADEFYTRACLGVQVMKLLKGRRQKRSGKTARRQTAGNLRAHAREIQPVQPRALNRISEQAGQESHHSNQPSPRQRTLPAGHPGSLTRVTVLGQRGFTL